jgi:hypothetical protein
MGWESRGDAGPYYYRKVRRGGRVVSEYIGRGEAAELIAALDIVDRDRREGEAADRRAAREEEAEADARLDGMVREALSAASARLAELGYHRHKGQWRRRRG